jgi:hypothetical protein
MKMSPLGRFHLEELTDAQLDEKFVSFSLLWPHEYIIAHIQTPINSILMFLLDLIKTHFSIILGAGIA